MSTRLMVQATMAAAIATGLAFATPAEARRGGGSDAGDSYLNDAQKNPRFIEPGGDYAYGRNRISHPSEGYYDRIEAERRGGYYPYSYRGNVRVRPYGY
ncbi:hypothetical protein [uncultured Enterovirga sp.]|uniref:hypothetical protein n=1 Tax=uncultured Enterovirga sp. TaxID=2026352 RepID=UPI0035CAF749